MLADLGLGWRARLELDHQVACPSVLEKGQTPVGPYLVLEDSFAFVIDELHPAALHEELLRQEIDASVGDMDGILERDAASIGQGSHDVAGRVGLELGTDGLETNLGNGVRVGEHPLMLDDVPGRARVHQEGNRCGAGLPCEHGMFLHKGAEDVFVVNDDGLGVILGREFANGVSLLAAVPADDSTRREVLGLRTFSTDMAGLATTEAAVVVSTATRTFLLFELPFLLWLSCLEEPP